MVILVAAVSGSVGALTRYFASGYVQRRTDSPLPLGTAAVNLLGAFALGLILGVGSRSLWGVAAIGFTGGLSTFSTWIIETVGLGVIPRLSRQAVINLVVLAGLGVAAAWLGYQISS